MVKCGKTRCKCAQGQLHGPYFYRVSWLRKMRARLYIRREEVAEVAEACQNYRELQARLRQGRRVYSDFLHDARAVIHSLEIDR